MNAIVYTTNAGSAERYARLLAERTGLPACSLTEAKKAVSAGAEVIYLGWIMAGSVKGYAEAAKRFRVRAVCGVGMGQTGTQTDSVRKKDGCPCQYSAVHPARKLWREKAARRLPPHDGDHGQNGRQGSCRKDRPHAGGGRYAGHDVPRRRSGQGGKSGRCS